MDMLAVITEIFRFFVSIFPRYVIINKMHCGIKHVNGNEIKKLSHDNGIYMPYFFTKDKFFEIKRSGIHIFWPMVTLYQIIPIKRQTVKLEPQKLTTADDVTVFVRGLITQEIVDAELILTEIWDQDDTVREFGSRCIAKLITSNNYEDISSIDFTEDLKEELIEFGINVIEVELIDLAKGKPILLLGIDNNTHIYQDTILQ